MPTSMIPTSRSNASSVVLLKNPPGYSDMAEVGNMPLPAKLLKRSVSDMVRS
jgi:L-arabonate dehydrase